MPKQNRISAGDTTNLRSALAHRKYPAATVLARVLLEAFVFRRGKITSDWWYAQKACPADTFTSTRNRLVEDEFLIFDAPTSRYFPGPKLIPYYEAVNKTKNATLSDLNLKVDKEEFEKLQQRNSDLERQVLTLQRQVLELQGQVLDLQRQSARTNGNVSNLERHVALLSDEMRRVATPPPSVERLLRAAQVLEEAAHAIQTVSRDIHRVM